MPMSCARSHRQLSEVACFRCLYSECEKEKEQKLDLLVPSNGRTRTGPRAR